MKSVNQTVVSGFVLLGLTDDPELQLIIFGVFLSMYLVTVLGNLLIILATSSESHLHTPMYFFLSGLSFNDIFLVTCTIPKMLVNIQTQDQNITYVGCLTQVCFVLLSVGMENCLLAAMAYDRYVAICHPLRYRIIMNPCLCILMIALSVMGSISNALVNGLMVLHLSFCTELVIPHFFCELTQITKLACSNTLIDNILIYISSCIFGGVPLSGIILSYSQIVSTVLRMQSSEGRYKAFSTCGSHLSVVSLFYGTGFGVYISSTVTESSRKTAVASVLYSVVPQMMNPFIYSLRNRDMRKLWRDSSVGCFLLYDTWFPFDWNIYSEPRKHNSLSPRTPDSSEPRSSKCLYNEMTKHFLGSWLLGLQDKEKKWQCWWKYFRVMVLKKHFSKVLNGWLSTPVLNTHTWTFLYRPLSPEWFQPQLMHLQSAGHNPATIPVFELSHSQLTPIQPNKLSQLGTVFYNLRCPGSF